MAKAKRKGKQRADGEGSVFPATRWTTRKGVRVQVDYFRGYVELPERNAKGDPKRKWISAATRKEAATKVRDAIIARNAGNLRYSADITVQQWLDHYIEQISTKQRGTRKGNRHNTVQDNKSLARNHVHPVIGSKKLEKLTQEDVEAVYQRMADAALSASTISKVRALLRSAFDEAAHRGRMGRNVAARAAVAEGAAPRKAANEITQDDARKLLAAMEGIDGSARWLLALASGLRQGEYLAVNEDDLDLEYGIYWPRSQIQRQRAEHGCGDPTGVTKSPVVRQHGCGAPTGDMWTHQPKTKSVPNPQPLDKPHPVYPCKVRQPQSCPQAVTTGGQEKTSWPCGKAQPAKCPEGKGGGVHLVPVKTESSTEAIPLPKPIVAAIKAQLQQRRKARLLCGDWKGFTGPDGQEVPLVFCQPNGRPIEGRRDYDEWREICQLAGVAPFNPHESRHATATMLVALGHHPKVVQGMMRHSTIAMSMKYARRPAKEIREAADAIAAALMVTDGLDTGTGD